MKADLIVDRIYITLLKKILVCIFMSLTLMTYVSWKKSVVQMKEYLLGLF